VRARKEERERVKDAVLGFRRNDDGTKAGHCLKSLAQTKKKFFNLQNIFLLSFLALISLHALLLAC
jgi:hypothetical protein